jgi:hypothetical protein
MSKHVVIDGSNLATEGRAMPSLKQLNEAIAAFRGEHPDDLLIVVADATFGHRIDASESAEFDAMVETGQIVCPPAGAIGRGDAFVLTIADKASAAILSNDSFQEFHGTYPWLFDEGRLIGGKPVPHIGWVFVLRNPVRGPMSRKSVQIAKRTGRTGAGISAELKSGGRPVSPLALEPLPAPKVPPPRARKVHPAPASPPHPPKTPAAVTSSAPAASPQGRPTSINDLLPFLEFVERHPVGSTLTGAVESFSSHGCYLMAGAVRLYLPLRSMADPAPRSAREAVKLGESLTVVVASFNAARRGVDVAVPAMFPPAGGAPAESSNRRPKRGARHADEAPVTKATSTNSGRRRKAAAPLDAAPVADLVPAAAPAKAAKAEKAIKATKATKVTKAAKAAKSVAVAEAVKPAKSAKSAKPAKVAKPAKSAKAIAPVAKAAAPPASAKPSKSSGTARSAKSAPAASTPPAAASPARRSAKKQSPLTRAAKTAPTAAAPSAPTAQRTRGSTASAPPAVTAEPAEPAVARTGRRRRR